MNVLVLNCGSSTVKFQIIETDQELIGADSDRRLASGVVERIGSQALITFQAEGQPKVRTAEPVRDHRAAIDMALRWIISPESKIERINSLADIHAVGHRVVHGGERFQRSVLVDDEVLEGIEDCIELAPLHNPANLKGIRAAIELLGQGMPQVAVFDTAFHPTMPEESYLYAIPYQLYRRYKVRRYGFHGTSHRYVAYRYRLLHGLEPEQVNIITLHLGNGCSACAIRGGQSFDTSMGFTPLEGLVMGTRSGDLDPVPGRVRDAQGGDGHPRGGLAAEQALGPARHLRVDLRHARAAGRGGGEGRPAGAPRRRHFLPAGQAYIGGYLAEMGGAESVVFTGGIGENSAAVRERVCTGLEVIGLHLDRDRNRSLAPGTLGEISADGSRLRALVIPTNEELLIARDTYRVVMDVPRRW